MSNEIFSEQFVEVEMVTQIKTVMYEQNNIE